MSTIGDYYDRKQKEFSAAYTEWQAAIRETNEAHQAFKENPTPENELALFSAQLKESKASQFALDAGNTGD